MPKRLEVFELPTKEQKQDYSLKALSEIMSLMDVDEVELVNSDPLNFTVRVPATPERILVFESFEGFEVSDSKLSMVKHRYDDRTAVSTNLTLDKPRGSFIISLNY